MSAGAESGARRRSSAEIAVSAFRPDGQGWQRRSPVAFRGGRKHSTPPLPALKGESGGRSCLDLLDSCLCCGWGRRCRRQLLQIAPSAQASLRAAMPGGASIKHRSSDPYRILGLEPGCSEVDAKRAYLQLAKQFHPDVCQAPDAADRFRDVTDAYEAVSLRLKSTSVGRPGAGGHGGYDAERMAARVREFRQRAAGELGCSCVDVLAPNLPTTHRGTFDVILGDHPALHVPVALVERRNAGGPSRPRSPRKCHRRLDRNSETHW